MSVMDGQVPSTGCIIKESSGQGHELQLNYMNYRGTPGGWLPRWSEALMEPTADTAEITGETRGYKSGGKDTCHSMCWALF